ncbi:MAG TPA: TIGR04282 family arsenosugar biosynthesis glycosyltransferase [Jatrophihabitantaceae bacterium]
MNVALIVIAKEPIPGRVKTRLVPPLTGSEAADLARAALSDTLRAASAVDARQRVLALDGRPGPWLPRGWRVVAQPAGSLDVRLVAAFSAASSGPALLIGMDTPQVRPAQLAAFDPDGHDACLGLAEDGGYWAIGLRNPALAAEVISGVPMSTSHTGAEQLRRLHAAGLRVQLLDTLADVDTIDVAYGVAAAAPSTEFAAALRGLDPAVAV